MQYFASPHPNNVICLIHTWGVFFLALPLGCEVNILHTTVEHAITLSRIFDDYFTTMRTDCISVSQLTILIRKFGRHQ